MPNKLELVGKRFGKLAVVSQSKIRDEFKNYRWLCKCDCGNEVTVLGYNLQRGNTLSCGCHKIAVKTKHGHTAFPNNKRTPEYHSWSAMYTRCYCESYVCFDDYGGRGIKVCDRWLGEHGFENFLIDMGPRPQGTTLDRWPNNDGDYGPGNCRWGTEEQQKRNKRNNHWIDYNGDKKIITDWAKIIGIKDSTLFKLLKGNTMDGVMKKYGKKWPIS